MRSPRSLRTRLLVVPIAGAMLLAACGGGGADDESADDGSAEAGAAEQADGDADAEDATVLTTAGVDLGGPEVDPASDVENNLFPDLVVDDIGRGKKVNIRNIVPSDKPVLLWMWAPH
jgi:hypothetical protein